MSQYNKTSLETLYANLSIEEEEEGGIVLGNEEVQKNKPSFVLICKFLTEKNINLLAMQNVMASIWRPKEGVEIHDIGGYRYSFVFYHVMDLKKVLEGGPWSFEQNMLIYKQQNEGEDPQGMELKEMEIWVQKKNVMLYTRIWKKEVERAYGTWLRTQNRNTRSGPGARWLRNAEVGGRWSETGGSTGGQSSSNVEKEMARFEERDEIIHEKDGDYGAVIVTPRNQEINEGVQINLNSKDNDRVILEPKRKRMEINQEENNNGPENMITDGLSIQNMDNLENGNISKNLIGVGSGLQAHRRHGGGLALLWCNEGGVEVKGSNNHFIDFEVSYDQVGRWRYTGFYGCPERRRRRESWQLIRELVDRSSLPWCIIGDFNDIMYVHEKRGGRVQDRYLLEGFKEAVNESGLQDLGYVGNEFTWERSRGSPTWIQERLDRGIDNYEWRRLFPTVTIKVLEVSTSDHLPLFLELNRQVYVPKTRRFRFENMWIKEDQCQKLVKDSWEEVMGRSIMEKVEYVCWKLAEWGGGQVKEMRLKLQDYRKEMRRYRARRDEYGVKKYNETRVKQFWLGEGDQNTRFFHNFSTGRKKYNKVVKLKDKSGVWREGREEIQNIITQYFDELFQASGTSGELTDKEVVNGVTEEHNCELHKPITYEEVKKALFEMYPEKSPRPDGLNPGFYQAYWEVVGRDMVEFCQKYFAIGDLPAGVNNTLVCLIPKVTQPQQMTDVRPISLCNILFRVLSKVLANRLKICLPSLISDKQSAFVQGRLLTDNALIAFELNHYIRRKTQGGNGVVGFKIDISKAYDRLEWKYLEGMLKKFGFGGMWIDRVMQCVRTVSYSFIHDGVEFGNVLPQRGIRLSSMLRRNEEAGLLHGCKIARGAPTISHLLFANDSYFFFKAKAQEANSTKSILQRYENLSGQTINYRKSAVTFSPNTLTYCKRQVCDILQVQESRNPGNYLGLPMFVGKRKASVFNFLKERVSKKLQNGSMKSISKGGKMVLRKTAAQTVPNFWMNFFSIPGEVCNNIQRLMNSYWWSNKGRNKGIRWMAWERLCESKFNGGLGFKDLRCFNVSMLAKQGWRLLNGDNPLVTALMKAKYFPKMDFLNARLGKNPSYMWRSIYEAQIILKRGSIRMIGNGEDTKVCTTPWLPCQQNGYITTSAPP
ncbi:uncharacterized protein LOC141673774 [Apium graveolens]|uniref:uncharacterized protein LOC141673774 n=1 Tax=Apium graveolens TaxID=4045 RepID=UPI003D7907B7